jgi:hypothetical protein
MRMITADYLDINMENIKYGKYKRDFWRGSQTGGFLRALRFPPPSKLIKS